MSETVKDPNIVLLKNVRLSYPKIFKPEPFGEDGGDPFYSANFILDKKDNADALPVSISTTTAKPLRRRTWALTTCDELRNVGVQILRNQS
jgi:hypothetical protein